MFDKRIVIIELIILILGASALLGASTVALREKQKNNFFIVTNHTNSH